MTDDLSNHQPQTHQAIVDLQQAGTRFDVFVCAFFPNYSRTQIQRLVEQGYARKNGEISKASARLQAGDLVTVRAEPNLIVSMHEPHLWQAQPGKLNIIHEDESVLVLDKPIGLVMYPAAGNHDSTLANFLLDYLPALAHVPRAGIVHRLDKDTSGLLVVAKTPAAHTHLVAALQARRIARQYYALVHGRPQASGTIETLLGRHAVHRQRQAVRTHGGKIAITHYQRDSVLDVCTLLLVTLDTGRTHQIRVHMSHIGHGIVGDPMYKAPVDWRTTPLAVRALLQAFPRQALHATRLQLPHQDGTLLDITSPLPEDMAQLIDTVRTAEKTNA